jgi:hypothetical protein
LSLEAVLLRMIVNLMLDYTNVSVCREGVCATARDLARAEMFSRDSQVRCRAVQLVC